jgi:hypothetical protein
VARELEENGSGDRRYLEADVEMSDDARVDAGGRKFWRGVAKQVLCKVLSKGLSSG